MTLSHTSQATAAAIVCGIVSAMKDHGIPVQENQMSELQMSFATMIQKAINTELYGIADIEEQICEDAIQAAMEQGMSAMTMPDITIIVTPNEGPIGPIIPGEPHWRN